MKLPVEANSDWPVDAAGGGMDTVAFCIEENKVLLLPFLVSVLLFRASDFLLPKLSKIELERLFTSARAAYLCQNVSS